MEINGHIETIRKIKGVLEIWGHNYDSLQFAINLMQEVADGRRPLLPAKVGDVVYVDTRTFMYGNMNGKSHAEGLVTSFVFGHRSFIKFHIFSPYVKQNKVFKYPLSAVGKTVFLTREAAEKALEAGKWIRSELSDCY